MATHFAAAAGAVSWMAAERLRNGKASALGAISGAVAGLATVTQGAGFVQPFSAIVIGLIAGALCHFAIGVAGTAAMRHLWQLELFWGVIVDWAPA